MVAGWIETLVTFVYTAISAGTGAVVESNHPDSASLVTAGFAIGAAALGFIPMQSTEAENKQRIFLEGLQGSLDEINQTLWQNHEKLGENQELLKENQAIMNQIQNMIGASAEENRKLMKGLHVSLQQFEKNMMTNFDKLKVFVVEKGFAEDTLLKINTVWHFLDKAMVSQKRNDLIDFMTAFEDARPDYILESFARGLENPSSNPVITAMKHDVLNSRAILENYKQLYSHLVAKVFLMKGCFHGLAGTIESADDILPDADGGSEFLLEVAKTKSVVVKTFIEHVSSYKMQEEKYWPDVVNTTILAVAASISYGSPDTGKVADSIKHQLSGIYTTDVFSIYVYHCSSQPHLYSYDCKPWPLMNFNLREIDSPSYDEKMARFMIKAEKNNYHIIVLKSKTSKEVDYESATMVRISYNAYAQLQSPIEQQSAAQSMRESVGNDPLIGTLHAHFKSNPNLVNGFVAFGKINPEIRFTNNGTSVLPVGQGGLPHKFYGLNWI